MIVKTKNPHPIKPKNLNEIKDDEISQKGKTKHIVETDWPTKESVRPLKKRKIKRIETARLP